MFGRYKLVCEILLLHNFQDCNIVKKKLYSEFVCLFVYMFVCFLRDNQDQHQEWVKPKDNVAT
jgi:hypothetical protein